MTSREDRFLLRSSKTPRTDRLNRNRQLPEAKEDPKNNSNSNDAAKNAFLLGVAVGAMAAMIALLCSHSNPTTVDVDAKIEDSEVEE